MALRQPLQHIERIVVTAFIQQHLRLRDQSHAIFDWIVAGGLGQVIVAGGKRAHAVCGARSQDGGKGRRLTRLERRSGRLFGLAEAAFEEIDQRLVESGARPVFVAALEVSPHPARHGDRNYDRAHCQIRGYEGQYCNEHRQIERKFGTPGRQYQQYVAVVVARRQHHSDGDGKKSDDPKQTPHQSALCIGLRVTLSVQYARGQS